MFESQTYYFSIAIFNIYNNLIFSLNFLPENIILSFESNSKDDRAFQGKEETGYQNLVYDSTICSSTVLDQEL